MSIELVPLNSIFEIKHGSKLDLNKMSKCAPGEQSIAFIGRSGERNGFVGFVERLEMLEPYESGLITVALGGSALSSFVQPRPFYTAQNIDVLRPRSGMSLDTKLYYCLCIEANRFRYSTYGREANRTLRNIMVPSLRHIPSWVSGAAKTAINNFSNELMGLIEGGEETTTLRRPAVLTMNQQGESSAVSIVATSAREEESAEDRRDIEIAKERLKQIDANPKSLISGDDLDKKSNELLS